MLQVLDVAVSLAKIADVDRALGKEDAALEGFKEGIQTLEGITFSEGSEDPTLEEKVRSLLGCILGVLQSLSFQSLHHRSLRMRLVQ